MKKIKLLLLITLIVTLCTGCDIEYNLKINENTIEETINVNDYITQNRKKSAILNHYNMWYPTFVNFVKEGESIEIEDFSEKVDTIEYHEKKIKEITDGYNYIYKYTYDIDNYHDAYSLANTYIETTVLDGYDALVLRTKKENLLCQYDYFETLTVNITIDPKIYKLNFTNARNVNGNTYTWYLNRNNCNDSEIILTLDKIEDEILKPSEDEEDKKNKQKKKGNYTIYIFCGILIAIILVGYHIFKKMKSKSESFNQDD